MMVDEPTVAILSADRVGEAVIVLRDAFCEDPIFCFHLPDPTLRAKALEISLTMLFALICVFATFTPPCTASAWLVPPSGGRHTR